MRSLDLKTQAGVCKPLVCSLKPAACRSGDREGIQRLMQYFLRCPFSQARMIQVTAEGQVIYKTEDNRLGRFPEASISVSHRFPSVLSCSNPCPRSIVEGRTETKFLSIIPNFVSQPFRFFSRVAVGYLLPLVEIKMNSWQ